MDHVVPASEATFAPLPGDLNPELVAALARRGVERLYSHQAEAYEAVRRGRNLVVVTPTASGKTLCYNLPVLQRLLEQPEKRALYLYPTKALAQDQLAELGALKSGLPIEVRVDTYDGDTPPGRRTAIREGGHVVMTNPDMLHTGLLPHHTRWRRLFSSLEFVVIDELHTYRGLFGSQVANVIRRLKRICAFYGSNPKFICASATIRNPLELAKRLLEEDDIALVERSGAPRGERRLVFYNPPLVSRDLGIRRSSMLEARRIAAPWIRAGVQTIVFCRSRLQVEVMLSYLREDLAPRLDASKRVRGYRAGYLPLHRREIEAGLRNGDITAVVSTNALELGIDIGSLQCAVLVGYPGTIASTWQQLGRAGRRSGSLGVFVASSSPLDQFIVRHPEYFLGTDPEEGLIDPDNLLLLAAHLQAGLFELPFMDDERLGSADVHDLLKLFEEDGSATRSAGRWFWSRQAFPAEEVPAGDWRDGSVHRAGAAARRSCLPARGRAVPRRPPRLGREEGLRPAGGRRLLHRRARVRHRAGPRHFRRTIGRRTGEEPWRSEDHIPCEHVQEDPVPHAREHRGRTDSSPRANAAHDRLLDHRRRRPLAFPGRGDVGSRAPGHGSLAASRREPATHVRPARPRLGGRGSLRHNQSTRSTRAGSVMRRACTRCIATCSKTPRRLYAIVRVPPVVLPASALFTSRKERKKHVSDSWRLAAVRRREIRWPRHVSC